MDAEYFVIVAAFLMTAFLVGLASLVVAIAQEMSKGGNHEQPSKDDAESVRGARNV